ncbi:mechanosensitive ion channel family protein [Caulobacter sp. KR2-114]|uniref:mechanosensitive ion channel family protein n=1 Tax=Caulobacter sp. KR2-114 TaxID=3400912 RepID=UPI003C0990B3
MSASERIWSVVRQGFSPLSHLSAAQVVVDVGLSALIVLVGALLALGAGRLKAFTIRRLFGDAPGVGGARLLQLADLMVLLLRGLIVAAVAALIGRAWGFDLVAWASVGLNGRVVALLLRLCLLALVAAAAFEAAGLLIGHGMGRIAAGSHDLRRQAQLRTLAPLLIGIVRTAVVVTFGLMALGDVGVNIGPLIAGAGVVGVALGFGAQSLVKDFITGVFLVVEDIVSVGDVVKIGQSGGLVERMTLRTIRLRDFDGALHVFPYSEAQVIHNLTKTFSCYVFNLQVSYSADLDRAMQLMRDVGAELQSEPEYGDRILEPLEVVGVDDLADSGVVLKARLKTVPLQQWSVGREYNRRIKLAFDREGVEIPYPHMKLVLPEGAGGHVAGHA